MNQKDSDCKVSFSHLTVTFWLPMHFGQGWEYEIRRGHSISFGNFAHDTIFRLKGTSETSLCVGSGCTVAFDVDNLSMVVAIQNELQRLVDAFPPRSERSIIVRGLNYWDSFVTEYFTCEDEYIAKDVPFRAYLVTRMPLATEHPAIDGADAISVLAEYGVDLPPLGGRVTAPASVHGAIPAVVQAI